MKKGEETLTPNWVFEAAYKLTNASDIKVLLFLARHWHYQNSSFGPGKLADELGVDYRTVTASLRRLGDLGHIISAAGEHCLHGACATVAHRLYKGMHKTTPTVQAEKPRQEQKNAQGYSEINGAMEVMEVTEEKEQEINTKAQETAAPRVASKRVRKSRAKGATTPALQALCAALTIACYGGPDALTDQAEQRVEKGAESLSKAGYTGEDVPLIAAWIAKYESWRTGPITPMSIADRAPLWKKGLNTTPGRMPKASELDDQDWAAEAALADERNRFLGEPSAAGWN